MIYTHTGTHTHNFKMKLVNICCYNHDNMRKEYNLCKTKISNQSKDKCGILIPSAPRHTKRIDSNYKVQG